MSNNHAIKNNQVRLWSCCTTKSQQYICSRNGILGSTDRRRWTSASWATGSGPAHSCVAQCCCCCRVAECVPTHGALQHSAWVHSQPRGVPWSPPCIKTSWARVQSGSTRTRTSFLTDHCVNKHSKVAGCHRLILHVVLLFFENIKRTSAFSYRPCLDGLLYHRRTVHFTAEELLTGQFSSWAEIQCSSPSPRGAQEHSSMPNRIHPDCSRLGAADISWVVRYYWSKQTLQTYFTIFNHHKMLRWTLVSSTNYILQLQEMIEWPFAGQLFIIVTFCVLFCESISMEALFLKLQSHIINNWETGSTWNPTQPRHLKLIKGLRTSWTQSHLKSEIKRLITDKQKSKFIVWKPKAAALGDLLLLPAKQPFSHCLHELPRS